MFSLNGSKNTPNSSIFRIHSTELAALVSLILGLLAFNVHAQEVNNAASNGKSKPMVERNFYEVLEDVLGDFEYDLKNGQVTGLKDLSIRNVGMSENVPPSYRNHLELAVTERVLKNSKTRIIQCPPCRAKKSTLNGDQVVITSPETNPVELGRIAKMIGIAHFLDIAFSYQPSGMILSMYITEPDSGNVVWSRSYNSEISRASAFRRGVDYTQIDDARKMNEYQPTIQHRLVAYYLFEKNISGMTGCVGAGYRMVERYDNRRKEVGFEANYIKDASSLVNSSTVATGNLYTGFNATLLFVHAWNFIGNEENFNSIRGSLLLGAGGTYASGFLGGLLRATYEWRLARHWAVSTTLGYRPPASAFIGAVEAGRVNGPEFGFGVNFLF